MIRNNEAIKIQNYKSSSAQAQMKGIADSIMNDWVNWNSLIRDLSPEQNETIRATAQGYRYAKKTVDSIII